MEQTKSVEGIVGFFDIIGYKSFLLNNSAERAAEEVLDALSGIKTKVQEILLPMNPIGIPKMLESFTWLVFSDTILLTTTFKEGETDQERYSKWSSFGMVCIALNRHMFDYGLPLRGAIGAGRFLLKEHCFAGKPIVDCHLLSQDLDLAACALTGEAMKQLAALEQVEMKRLSTDTLVTSDVMFPDYLAPRKSGKDERLRLLNWASAQFHSLPKIPDDIRQYVLNSFWKHKKDVSVEVLGKVTNTEQWIRYGLQWRLKHGSPSA